MAQSNLNKELNNFAKNWRTVQNQANKLQGFISGLSINPTVSYNASQNTKKEEEKVKEPVASAPEATTQKQTGSFQDAFASVNNQSPVAIDSFISGNSGTPQSINVPQAAPAQSQPAQPAQQSQPAQTQTVAKKNDTSFAGSLAGDNGNFITNETLRENLNRMRKDSKKETKKEEKTSEGGWSFNDTLKLVQKTIDMAKNGGKEEKVDDAEYITYTYKPGDTFGQVLKDLGLGENNLWGENGTVKYYSDQLWAEHPEVFDSRGNIPIGTTIRLRKRK